MNVFEARKAAEEHGFVVVTTLVNTTYGTHRQPLRLRFRNTLQPRIGAMISIEEFRRWAGEQS